MNKIEILKEWYYKEEERKLSIDNSINLLIGILTAIIGAIYIFVTNYNFDAIGKDKDIFIIFLGITIILWFITIIFLFIAFNKFHKGYIYNGYPCSNFLENIENDNTLHFEQYKQYYTNNNIDIDKLNSNSFEITLVRCIDNNLKVNDVRFMYIFRAKTTLIYCLVSLFLACTFFCYNFIKNPKEDIQKVKLI